MSDNDSSSTPEAHDAQNFESEEQVQGPSPKRALLVYTVARMGILLACLAIVYVLGARGVIWIIISFVISALLSYLLLAKLRDQITSGVGNHMDKLNSEVEEGIESDSPYLDGEVELPVAKDQTDREK